MDYDFQVNGKPYSVSINKKEDGYAVEIGGKTIDIQGELISENTLSLERAGGILTVHGAEDGGKHFISLLGHHLIVEDMDRAGEEQKATAEEAQAADGTITTPMPGNIVKVLVKEGDAVTKGQTLVIVESMKMENDMIAPADGTVRQVHVAPGDQTQFGQVLVELELQQGE
jgi:biotin carboxyl carrier protein